MERATSKLGTIGLGLGLFLLVWGGKLDVIQRGGSDLPWWDDWPAIGLNLLVPHARGTLEWSQWLAPHNEHRITGTRLIDFGLVALNGQWDARLECAFNAALHALLVVGAFLLGRGVLPRAAALAWFVVLAAFTAPPVVWENVVRGFDSQHYLLIGFSVATMTLWLTSAAGSARWWIGLGCGLLALFTMGSGLVASACVIIVLLATQPRETWWRAHRGTLFAAAGVVVLGLLLAHHVPEHDAYRAHNVREFFVAFWHHLQWPLVLHPEFGVISNVPWLVLTWRCVRRPREAAAGDRVVVAVGLWALLHYAAMAYYRGSLQPWPPTRGLENVVVGLLANAFALLLLAIRARWRSWPARFGLGLALAGVATCAYGLNWVVQENYDTVLPSVAVKARQAEAGVRRYLLSGDVNSLHADEIPYPSATSLAAVLDVPEIRALLPASVRVPLLVGAGAGPKELARPGATVIAGAGDWQSALVGRTRFDRWLFDVGTLAGRESMAAELRTADGRVLGGLARERAHAAIWTSSIVHAPAEPVRLVLHSGSPGGGIAVVGPVEIGAASAAARWFEHRGLLLAGLGLILSVGGWLTCVLRRSPVVNPAADR